MTQYRGYLDFVCGVGETCGFQVEEDALRIPSTKRVNWRVMLLNAQSHNMFILEFSYNEMK